MGAVFSLEPSYYGALKRLTLELAGISLGNNHEFLIETRLSALARKEGYDDLRTMIEELFTHGQTRLAIHVVSALLERDTHFFDDHASLDAVIEHCVPALHSLYKGSTLRILCFGCSSGQEPYSLAMALQGARERFPGLGFEITGIDYPSLAIDRARTGRYTHFEVQRGLPIQQLVDNFTRIGEDWVLKDSIRQMVTFKDFHLLDKAEGLGTFHIALFRNRLGFYSAPAQIRVMRELSTIISPLGYLVMGSNENLGGMNYGFDIDEAHSFIARKREKAPEVVDSEPRKKPSGRKDFNPVNNPKDDAKSGDILDALFSDVLDS